MPMPTTGGERYTVYIYFKTYKYFKGIEQAWEDDKMETSSEVRNEKN